MATPVETALADLQARRVPVALQVEGFQHFLEQQDITAESRGELDRALAGLTQRLALMNAGIDALRNLIDDGDPIVPPIDVSPSVITDTGQNKDSVNAAFALLRSNAASDLGLVVSSPEPK